MLEKFKKYFTGSWRIHIFVAILLISSTALIELLMGRIPICKCGYVAFWYGNIYGSGNSQHLFDWYTFSHIIHGIIFFFFFWLVTRRLPLKTRLILAIVIECAWEIAENSPFIIDRYRAATSALDYTGDSVINSVFDIFSAMFGFYLASKLRVWHTVVLVIFLELFTLYEIRDNLTLNVIMLIHPVQAIKTWQLEASFVPPSLRGSSG